MRGGEGGPKHVHVSFSRQTPVRTPCNIRQSCNVIPFQIDCAFSANTLPKHHRRVAGFSHLDELKANIM